MNSFGLKTFEAWKPQGVPWRKPFNGVFREGVSRLKSSSFVGILKGIDVFLLKKRCLKNDKCAICLKYSNLLGKLPMSGALMRRLRCYV